MTAVKLYKMKRKRIALAASLIVILLFFFSILSLSFGTVRIAPLKGISIFVSYLPFLHGPCLPAFSEKEALILMDLRVPRLLLALFVGGGLASCGAALQALFKNPLVDPYITGISSGATLGVALSFFVPTVLNSVLGFGQLSFFAFAGGMVTSIVVFYIGIVNRRFGASALLLSGISLNLFLSALVSLLMFLGRNRIEKIVLWVMGSLSSAYWSKLAIVIPVVLLGTTGLFVLSRGMNAISLDDDLARTMGVRVSYLRYGILFCTSLVTSVAVASCGIIGFVGLVAPHIIRMGFTHNYRALIPLVFLLGALLLLVSDLIARVVIAPSQLPVGIVTSLIGVPFFLLILFSSSRREHE